jgi:hypothetical protein
MSLIRKLVLAAAVSAVALLAIAGTASAKWAVEGKEFTEAQSETVTLSATEKFDFNTKILGSNFTFTATTVTCSGTCTINQTGAVDVVMGKLSFSGVTVDAPTGCTITGPIITNALRGELIMDPSGGTATFLKLFPASGEVWYELVVSGCAAAGVYPFKGTLTGRTNNTGVAAVTQPITFSAAEQTTGGGAFKAGKEPSTISGKLAVTLSGANKGKTWSGS